MKDFSLNYLFQQPMDRIRRIHFVGIGGSGMCGIAEVLLNQGYEITGSDLLKSANTLRLEELGAKVFYDHKESNIKDANVLVFSSAIPKENPEIVAAKHRRIPVVPRAVMLGELMRFRYGIAVSGSHGKTTTTSLVSHILAEAGFDPTFVIGGKLNGLGSHARLGASHYIVAEADESDASFLYLKPMTTIVTNIDSDHMENYEGNILKLQQTFSQFLHLLPFYGTAVLCIEDPYVLQLVDELPCRTLTYGFRDEADLQAINCKSDRLISYFQVKRVQKAPLEIELNLPGQHNVLNSLAAIAAVSNLGISDKTIQNSLKTFSGVGRRFDWLGTIDTKEGGSAELIDDYGHHPREIAATIKTAREVWPDKRLVMLFQPHRYSRTKALFEEFVQVLSFTDVLFILDVYSAGENAIEGYDSKNLLDYLQQKGYQNGFYIPELSQCYPLLLENLKDNDLLLTQGAGSIGLIAQELSNHFNIKKRSRL